MKQNHIIPINHQYSLDIINIGDQLTDVDTCLQGEVEEIIKHYRRSGHSYTFVLKVKSFLAGVFEIKQIKYVR